MFTVRPSTGVVAALALALSLSGCSSSTTATDGPTDSTSAVASVPATSSSSASGGVGTANEAFCTSSAALRTELGDLRALVQGGSVTIEALQTQRQDLAAAGNQARTDAQALDQAVQAEVAAAQAAFQAAMDAIPADQTGVKEIAAYVAAAAVFGRALDSIDNEVGCS